MLRYNLFVKTKLQTEIEELIKNLTYSELIAFIKKMKKTNKYTNLTILVLEQQV